MVEGLLNSEGGDWEFEVCGNWVLGKFEKSRGDMKKVFVNE